MTGDVYVVLSTDVDGAGRFVTIAKAYSEKAYESLQASDDPLVMAVFVVDAKPGHAVATVLRWLFMDRPSSMPVTIRYERKER